MGEPPARAARIALIGYGPVGRAILPLLCAAGKSVRILQRRAPIFFPSGCSFLFADVEKAGEAARACADIDVVVCAVGIPYVSHVYVRAWPVVMRNLLDACAASRARFDVGFGIEAKLSLSLNAANLGIPEGHIELRRDRTWHLK